MCSFPEFCTTATGINVPLTGADMNIVSLYIGLAANGKLHVVREGGSARTLANNANSFTVASGFVIYTTFAHTAQFAPLETVVGLCSASSDEPAEGPTWETRRVERGSRIVTAVPSNMSLVLQMPRGNLETINPRPLVMAVVRQDIRRCVSPTYTSAHAHCTDSGEYGKAFSACRKHRIDLNVFVDQDRDTFMRKLPQFVEQVDDVDYINLFLTNIG